jgi:CheY-like chemotaxis protein
MSMVLVVDDAAGDRLMVQALLAGEADLEVQLAAQGAEALALMAQRLPDVVITDLLMPEMTGLELVATIRRQYPQVPVVLMTSRGSEEIAAEALRLGAASYIPKRLLAYYLRDTIREVLSVASPPPSQAPIWETITESTTVFLLENDAALFAPLVAYLQERAGQMGICDHADRTRVGIALEEALCNALYHGNLEIGSQLRETDTASYYALVQRRRRESPYQQRRIAVEAQFTRRAARFSIRDDGAGFDPRALPDPTDPVNLEKASGRGILLMRAFMDEVNYNAAGNTVTLVKRCKFRA